MMEKMRESDHDSKGGEYSVVLGFQLALSRVEDQGQRLRDELLISCNVITPTSSWISNSHPVNASSTYLSWRGETYPLVTDLEAYQVSFIASGGGFSLLGSFRLRSRAPKVIDIR